MAMKNTNGDNMIKIYGKNCIYEAIKANAKLKEVYILDTLGKKDKAFIEMLKDKNINFKALPKEKLNQQFGQNNQGYAAIREDYFIYDEDYLYSIDSNAKRILILDGIMDPHNLGAILRSVDAFGVDLVILPKNRSCSLTETVAHVSTGAIEHVKIMYVNSLLNTITKLKKIGFWICGTDAKGNILTSSIDKNLKLAIIIGSEGFGMSKTLVNASDYLISIPMVGHVNSLNASVSCGIVLSELMKKGE